MNSVIRKSKDSQCHLDGRGNNGNARARQVVIMGTHAGFKQSMQIPGIGKVVYQSIGNITAAKLNEEVRLPYNAFNAPKVDGSSQGPVRSFDESIGATNDVSLYRLIYNTKIPENNKTFRVSGLLAVPVLPSNKKLPLVSWQHGTLFSPLEAPSELARNDGQGNAVIQKGPFESPRSTETLFNVVRLAGNGYALAAADYIGNGKSKATQAWGVKGATQKTIVDMLKASQSVLRKIGHESGALFSNGWSQGGMNTQWLGEQLQKEGIPIQRQASSSGPTDLQKTLSYWINDYPGSPPWLTAAVPIFIGSYEEYYDIRNLMKQAIRPQYLRTARQIYNKKIDWDDPQIYIDLATKYEPDGKGFFGLPTQPKDMLTGKFIRRYNNGKGDFYQQVTENSALTVRYSFPTRFYGGKDDNVVPESLSIEVPIAYQEQLGSVLAEGISIGDSDHSGTFLGSLFGSTSNPSDNLLDWFNMA